MIRCVRGWDFASVGETKEVEITPAMIEAGRAALAEFFPIGEIAEDSILIAGMVHEVLTAAMKAA